MKIDRKFLLCSHNVANENNVVAHSDTAKKTLQYTFKLICTEISKYVKYFILIIPPSTLLHT